MSIALEPQANIQNDAPGMSFSSERNLDSTEQQTMWSQVTESVIKIDDISLAYSFIEHPKSQKAIVISSGRIESYIKYRELIFDLYRQGYSIYALDHRGQGLSSRTTNNPQQGHIDRFETYIDDFTHFIDVVVKKKNYKDLFLVGHSMGGTIGTLYMEKHPDTFRAAAFSAPMYGIKLPISRRFIRWLAQLLDTTDSDKGPNYVLGGGDYEAVEFAKNDLTNCQLRYDNYKKLYLQHPQVQVGSPTNRWLHESIDAAERAISAARNSQMPILILQADEDTVVDNFAQYHAVGGLCQLINIPHARHEVFMEQDESRNMALTELVNFLQAHAS
ncbi:Lysophospholipase [Shewanella sediminis HAW-EB3]|uniref:Lysophospholipase n=1 Tax=Shewanella sediminis (strain HAW-EB3) TaxID=425104 RepID=A8FPC8_SHESH|nr:alpha/beta fold hydrolase [Shewanella sediminis]ABV34701.1 Lysophospholipase [Shewanella sediminis HAW-EB3]